MADNDSVPGPTQPSTQFPMPTLTPATPVEVNRSLTIAFTSLYGLLFLLIFSQLFLILYYRHRRFSYQSVFLFICLIWAALRTTLFAFHFKSCDCAKAYELPSFWRWLLYEFPVFLQYLTLCLLAFYFGKAVLKTKWNMEPQKYRKQLRITFGILISIFLASTIVYSVVMSSVVNPSAETQRALGISRVAISQTLFVVTAFALCVCILQLKRASSANLLLEGQGTSICQATTVCIVIGLLFVSRAVYDLLAVSLISLPKFGYGWIYVSDEAETVNGGTLRHETGSNGFVSFGIVLFIWELLPTFIVVWFFRVRRPPMDALVSNVITSNSFNRRSFFFDNIRRYDSDADLYAASSPPRIGSQYDIPGDGLSASVVNSYNDISDRRNSSYSDRRNNSYGDRRNNSFAAINGFVPGTTPPLLFSGSNQYQPSGNIGPVTAYR